MEFFVAAVYRGGTGVSMVAMLPIMLYILVHGLFTTYQDKILNLFAVRFLPYFLMITR